MHVTRSLLVSFDKSDKDNSCVLIVGEKNLGQNVEIVNAFQGEEAEELWNKLITVKKKESKE